MNIETRLTEEGLVVRPLESRLDAAGAVQFKDAIRALVPGAPSRMILDLGLVSEATLRILPKPEGTLPDPALPHPTELPEGGSAGASFAPAGGESRDPDPRIRGQRGRRGHRRRSATGHRRAADDGIGGDCFALVAKPDGEVLALNGSGRAPAALDAEAIRSEGHSTMPLDHARAVTVPGAIDAFCRLSAARSSRPTSS